MAIFSAITAVLLTSCATAGIPEWVKRMPADKGYLYFIGIKTEARTMENGKRSAVAQAITELVEHFEIEAKANFHEKRTELETKILDEIGSSSSSVKVKGVLLKDWHFNKNADGSYDVYVLVQYPREELAREKVRLQNKAISKVLYARKALHKGREDMERGEVGIAYASFMEAQRIGSEINDSVLINESTSGIKILFDSIRIEAIAGSGQKTELYKGLNEPLEAKVSLANKGTSIPAQSVPVLFKFSGTEGELTERAVTDSEGYARCKVESITKASQSTAVQATLDVDRLFIGLSSAETSAVDLYIEALKSKTAEFTFDVDAIKRNIKVLVLVREENNGVLTDESITANVLSEALRQAGFSVIAEHEIGRTNAERLREAIRKERLWPLRPELLSEVDLAIVGTAITRKGSANMGAVDSSHADLFIKAIDLKSGVIVAQKTLVSLPGFGDTLELAGIRALTEAGKLAAESLIRQLVFEEEVGRDAIR